MTLKEKLNDSIITNINIVESENRMCYDYNHLELAEECEKVTEEFAIGFAEWCDDNYFRMGNTSFWAESMDWDNDNKFTTKELLEIYKKNYDIKRKV